MVLPESNDRMGNFNKVEDANPLIEMLQLLISGDDLKFKTRIKNARAYAILETLADACIKVGFEDTGTTILLFLESEEGFLVSEKGKSREEFVDAFKSVNDTIQNMSIGDKLTKNLKEEL